MEKYLDTALHVLTLGIAGGLIGLGQLLLSKEVLTVRLTCGRGICSGGLGLAAALGLQWFPGMSNTQEIALACVFASLGTSGIEALLQRFLGK